jgi:hypothetical protein
MYAPKIFDARSGKSAKNFVFRTRGRVRSFAIPNALRQKCEKLRFPHPRARSHPLDNGFSCKHESHPREDAHFCLRAHYSIRSGKGQFRQILP